MRRMVIAWIWLLSGILMAEENRAVKVRVLLNERQPELSMLELVDSNGERRWSAPVGFGREGILPAGGRFKGGYSLLGMFEVSAVLGKDHFAMDPRWIQESGRSEGWLRQRLFANMSAIDFDGDSRGGEYGDAFLGLFPVGAQVEDQPFHFGEYRGIFRWYSYAIHGTQDESRIGKKSTGGCINLGQGNLQKLMGAVRIGDLVEVRSMAYFK